MQSVLKWVNEIRVEHGMPAIAEMPKGCAGTGYDCPLANAFKDLDANVYVGRNSAHVAGRRYVLPDGIAQFVTDVDLGRRPELLA